MGDKMAKYFSKILNHLRKKEESQERLMYDFKSIRKIPTDEKLEIALLCQSRKEYSTALKIYKKVLREESENATALLRCGLLYAGSGRNIFGQQKALEKARRYLERAEKINKSSDVMGNLGYVLMDLGRLNSNTDLMEQGTNYLQTAVEMENARHMASIKNGEHIVLKIDRKNMELFKKHQHTEFIEKDIQDIKEEALKNYGIVLNGYNFELAGIGLETMKNELFCSIK